MLPILTLFITVGMALVITRIATVALTLTGLSQEAARFQARSAYTGVGFTTKEAERVTEHPVRRRIIMALMLTGNIGLVAVVGSLLLSFLNKSDETHDLVVMSGIAGGLILIGLLSRSKYLELWMSRIIERSLRKWTTLSTHDYASLLHLSHGFNVAELVVEPGDFMSGQLLSELELKENGILVLGIERHDGEFIGSPRGDTQFEVGDNVIVYGPGDKIGTVCGKTTST